MSLTVMFFVLGFVVTAALALLALVLADRQRRHLRARLERARGVAANRPVPDARPRPRGTRREDPAGRIIARLERRIARSGLRLGAGELLVQVALGVLGIYAGAVLVLGLHPLLVLPLAMGLPLGAAALVLASATARTRARFTAALPEALDVFARGLRAGRPVADSLAIVVETSDGPISREFARCRDEMHLGTSLAESLDRLSARVPTPEVTFFAVATALQAETGGNLIETMENLAGQLRERRKLRRKARALSSEARASAAILAALPFAVACVLAVLNFGYLAPLLHDPRGQVMSLSALVSIGLGILLMIRMGKLDV